LLPLGLSNNKSIQVLSEFSYLLASISAKSPGKKKNVRDTLTPFTMICNC